MSKSKKSKPNLKQLVSAAHQAGAQVQVELKPRTTSTEPIRLMCETLEAIYHLAETRKLEALKTARVLLRRISTNDVQFILMKLEQEEYTKPVLERNY